MTPNWTVAKRPVDRAFHAAKAACR
jgi:hypothetical protein